MTEKKRHTRNVSTRKASLEKPAHYKSRACEKNLRYLLNSNMGWARKEIPTAPENPEREQNLLTKPVRKQV
jgi:hypothetical protein